MIRVLFCFTLLFIHAQFSEHHFKSDTDSCIENYSLKVTTIASPNHPANEALISWDLSFALNYAYTSISTTNRPNYHINTVYNSLNIRYTLIGIYFSSTIFNPFTANIRVRT